MLRRGTAIVCGILLAFALSNAAGVAKARLIAVFTLRSTPALANEAKTASKSIVGKLSGIEGYDAQLLAEPKTGTLGAAAAAAGAEIYLVGQLTPSDGGYKITIGSFAAATDQPINTYTATLTNLYALPDQPDIKLLIAAAAPPQAPVPQTKVLALLPYEEPGSTDPFEIAVSQALAGDVSAAGVAVTKIGPLDAVEAVANAGKICAATGASGILVPRGRFQQTLKPGFLSMTVTTHVDFRLDDVECDGVIRWSTTTTGDDTVTGMSPNIAGSINTAYSAAVQRASAARATASIPQTSPSAVMAPPASAPATVSTYALLPFDVLGMTDQRSADMTHALLTRLQARKLDVKVAGAAIDPVSAVAHAAQICTTNGAQAIIVPSVRMEQASASGSGSTPHASLSLSVLSCSGAIMRHAVAQGGFKPLLLFFRDPDGAVVNATDDASDAAIRQLFALAST